LMLHNYEDVVNLPEIFKVVNVIDNDLDLLRKEKLAKKQMSLMKNNINTKQPLKTVSSRL
ncbi:hypothetical protein KPL50_26575, partial [Clostridium sp. CF012]|nr:hypothetical protein [Clostridium sp. CF012]